MDGSTAIALLSVIVSPLAALTAVWLTARLAANVRRSEAAAQERREALDAIAGLMSIVIDADPNLVVSGDLREYNSPEQAVEGLYERWRKAREPLVLLSLAYPTEQGRHLAFDAQAKLEMALRLTDDAVRAGDGADLSRARAALGECGADLQRLAQMVSALGGPRLRPVEPRE